jgi:predicted transcriptional regulator
MQQRINAHKKSQKSAPSLINSIEKLVEGGKYNTISRIEKKTGINRTTISARLSDLERVGKIFKSDESSGKETIYGTTPQDKVKRTANSYAKMRVNCMLKTLKENYYAQLPQELKNYFDETSCG